MPLAVVAIGAFMGWSLQDLNPSSVLKPSLEPVILLEAADGQKLSRRGPLRGVPVARRDIPGHLADAVVAIEDRRFYDHQGIDPQGILRAFARNMRAGAIRQGGSTITQQLARTLIREDERTFRRKIREAVLAVFMERKLSKDDILTRYLNNIYFGAGLTGVSAAARVYFDKAVRDLSLQEAALLAGLIQAPSHLNPLRNLDQARSRAALVLDAMVGSGKLDPSEAEAAKRKPAELNPGKLPSTSGSWFADWSYEEAAKIAGSFEGATTGAVRVRTTLSPELQAWAERTVSAAMTGRAGVNDATQVALVAMRPDGAVLAMVGGRDYGRSQFNRAVKAMRQPGSTFKLFVYFAALRSGRQLYETIEDGPVRIRKWAPKNFDGRYHGDVTLIDAFARSLNVATVRLAQEVGIENVVEAARALGIDARLAATPSLALGSSEVSLLDLTGAYASVRAGRAPIEPWTIASLSTLDQERSVELGPPVRPGMTLEPYRRPLVELLTAVVDHGTGRAAALDGFAAGKTGTTENHRDAWFVGFNEDLVAGVWVGNDDNTPMTEITGGNLPATIWKDFMEGASRILKGAQLAGMDAANFDTLAPAPDAGALCDYDACSSAYRSFRASDCTYQPYSGPRKQCQRGLEDNELIIGGFDVQTGGSFQQRSAQALMGNSFARYYLEPSEPPSNRCDYSACAASYRSFRASDCTYQPFRGSRKLCRRGGIEMFEEEEDEEYDIAAEPEDEFVDDITEEGSRCDYEACARSYRSFRASDCSYQPYRGRRKLCLLGTGEAGWGEPGDDEDDAYFEADSGYAER